MNTLTVVHLVMVIITGLSEPDTQIKKMPSIGECKQAEIEIHEMVKKSVGVVDIGTICVKSEFDLTIKPRA